MWINIANKAMKQKRNQVLVSESDHGANLAMKISRCNDCVEENQVCNCDHKLEPLNNVIEEDFDDQHRKKANGLGQLSTPYALEKGGWVSSFLLIGLGVISSYSLHLLRKSLSKKPKSRSYTDIRHNAFGPKGRITVATFILEIFMALVSYTISLHDNITTVFSGIQIGIPKWIKLSTSQLLTIMAVLVALPSLWLRNLSSTSFLSFSGILMSLVIFTSVAYTTIFGGVKASHNIPALQLHNIPAISGLYIFSYAGHVVFPDLYTAMKDPSKFTKVSIVSFSMVTVLYTVLAFMGANLFGPNVNSQITLSMPPHAIVTKIALWATVLTPMTKYALEFASFAIQFEQNLPDSISSKTKMIIRGTVGSLLLMIILTLALCVPYFEHVLSLTGSFVSIATCVIFPCAFYIKICWDQISKPLVILNLGLIVLGSFLGVIGTTSSSKSLIKSLKRAHST